MATSTTRPSPVFSRSASAARIPMTLHSPPPMSAICTPGTAGGPSAGP